MNKSRRLFLIGTSLLPLSGAGWWFLKYESSTELFLVKFLKRFEHEIIGEAVNEEAYQKFAAAHLKQEEDGVIQNYKTASLILPFYPVLNLLPFFKNKFDTLKKYLYTDFLLASNFYNRTNKDEAIKFTILYRPTEIPCLNPLATIGYSEANQNAY